MSGLVFEKLTQSLSAGQVWRLSIAADFFRIAAAEWPVKVRILKAGRIMGEMDGWQAGDFVRDVEFDAVEVEAGAISQAVTVQIAGGGVGSDRVIGEVSVIDGGAAKTRGGKCFVYELTASTTAGNYGAAQLYNPPGSGVDLVVSKFAVSANVAADLFVRGCNYKIGTENLKCVNKLVGGAQGAAVKTRKVDSPVQFLDPALFLAKVGANETVFLEAKEPVVVQQGFGVYVSAIAAGVVVVMFAEFEEVSA